MDILEMNDVVEVAAEEIVKGGLNLKKLVIGTVVVTATGAVIYVCKKAYDKKQAKKNEVKAEYEVVEEDIIEE